MSTGKVPMKRDGDESGEDPPKEKCPKTSEESIELPDIVVEKKAERKRIVLPSGRLVYPGQMNARSEEWKEWIKDQREKKNEEQQSIVKAEKKEEKIEVKGDQAKSPVKRKPVMGMSARKRLTREEEQAIKEKERKMERRMQKVMKKETKKVNVEKKKEEVKVTPSIDIEDIWKRDLKEIGVMRRSEDAAVDLMGCHMLHDKQAEPKVQRFQILLALMLSSQTKDEVTSAAMQRLRWVGCTIEGILAMKRDELEELLKPVGFYRRKAGFIQEAAAVLKAKYDGDIPDTVEGLCTLNGVGPKMANLAIQTAFGRTMGIAVDTHVHRIVNRLGWTKTRTPEQTQKNLEELLPREEWPRLNKLLVGFGQQTCLPVRPKCADCLLKATCPSSSVKKMKEKEKKEEEEKKQ